MYVIIKEISNSKGIKINVILVDSYSEVWEFDSFEEADKMRTVFEANSDSGYKYTVKKIGG